MKFDPMKFHEEVDQQGGISVIPAWTWVYTWGGGADGVKIFLFQSRTLLPSTSIWNGRTCI